MPTITQTGKTLLAQNAKQMSIWNHSQRFGNANASVEIHNPNAYAIEVCVSLQAGSGDYNNATYHDGDGWQRFHNGRKGNSLSARIQTPRGDVMLTAEGGAPNIPRSNYKGSNVYGERTWNGDSKGWGDWHYYAQWKVCQSGDSAIGIYTLKPNGRINITCTNFGAQNSSFHGSITISAII
ncbi:hypothetical protein CQA49_00095 [Helicobacter sp. MIT 00-7814]|uniref:hypothetical protein n=1 Tax=unclassified Helicobacter TaxID=2593540 RepID=UPI000E1EB63F|nr:MULTISPECIES: hypothetical protein [unclassified Helicobacter]RDU57105.1 hypothetical protein CQA49_00095 [Helicobacter sp. MIT 00-7814]RDU57656.1 hypothetical protein CQA37_00095 [Helicobacter sp. MIT 99-10781]